MRTTLTRDFYIPKEYTRYIPEIGDYPEDLFACYVDRINLRAIFFIRKQSKPAWHLRFRNSEAMAIKVTDSIRNLMSREEKKAERKVERSKPHTLKIGDILYSSWGYEQTNINFYQVTKLIGKQSVEIREIGFESTPETSFMTAEKRAIKDAFMEREKPMVKRVDGHYNSVRLTSYSNAWLDDGRWHRYSWYG